MSDEIRETVERFLSYHWQWPLITQLTNRLYGTSYTDAELHGAYTRVVIWNKTFEDYHSKK